MNINLVYIVLRPFGFDNSLIWIIRSVPFIILDPRGLFCRISGRTSCAFLFLLPWRSSPKCIFPWWWSVCVEPWNSIIFSAQIDLIYTNVFINAFKQLVSNVTRCLFLWRPYQQEHRILSLSVHDVSISSHSTLNLHFFQILISIFSMQVRGYPMSKLNSKEGRTIFSQFLLLRWAHSFLVIEKV